jgi:hypothetical protein
MSGFGLRASACVMSLVFLGCVGDADLQGGVEPPAGAFMQVSRDDALTSADDGGAQGVTSGQNFYVALKKSELGSKWFLSAFLTQWHPSESIPVRSVGTKVVTFAVQNGKLFVFDATDGKAWSDTLDPTIVIEAYPLVTGYAPFNALPYASDYVLFDPGAGLNRFSVVSDDFAQRYSARFQVDLTYLQRYRQLGDGASWEEVFTGYTEIPGPGVLSYDQPFMGSGTLEVALRRYSEGPGFTAAPLTANNFFGSSNLEYVKNGAAYSENTVKWNIHPGMDPIQWRIQGLDALLADPQYQGVDIAGAIERGVESWNGAFGFPIFDLVQGASDDSVGDDEKNIVFIDHNPGAGLAFANWRENPNTGEIRGASVYFSSAFIAEALSASADAGVLAALDAGTPATDAGAPQPVDAGPVTIPCAPNVVISQVFGGSSTTAAYNQDFVELHNRTAQDVSLNGWSVQYASATGTAWQVVPLSGTVAAGGFFLLGLSASDGGTALPAVNATGSVNLSSTAGKVALVSGVAPLSGCPAMGAAVDLVGYGGASCSETSPVPGTSSAMAVARRDACADSDSNVLDFSAQMPAPRGSAGGVAMCTCIGAQAPASALTAPDGGSPIVLQAPQALQVNGMLAWDGMPDNVTCALKKDLRTVAIPAGQTRQQFIEAVITHAVAHEVGHTLGLRHNFKGSLAASSVMDYLRDDDAAALTAPGAYDGAAVKYLYGLDPNPPTQPFCTDENMAGDAQCDVFDTGADPLTTDVAPTYTAVVHGVLAGANNLTYGDIFRLTRYVRGPESEAQRLQAFNALIGDVAPPIQPGVTALGSNANAWADLLGGTLLANLFLDPAAYRDGVQVNPALTDDTFRARVIAVASGILTNSDGIRSFEMRRIAVDVLKVMQTNDAYQALLAAKTAITAERATLTAQGQALDDDLLARINAETSPYFQ